MLTKIYQRPLLVLGIVSVLVFALQPIKLGFEPGHHGWVSAHSLSIISNARPENNFLGYARKTVVPEGVDYVYFDRHPILFSAVTHTFLSPYWDNLKAYIYMGRQWMNVIYVLMLFFMYRLCTRIVRNKEDALPLTLMVMSASFLVNYKDMVHFDQPAILGCLLLLNGIVDFELTGKKKFLWIGCLIGPLLGLGYAVNFFVLAWVLVKFFRQFKHSRKLIPAIEAAPIFWLFISVPLPVLSLASNVVNEAKIRNVSVRETSIVESAERRLGFKSYTNRNLEEKQFSWPSFVNSQVQRVFDFFTPFFIYKIHVKNFKAKLQHYLSLIPKALFQFFLVFLMFKYLKVYWRQLTELEKQMSVTLMSGGLLWIMVMRNLANYHEYVTFYLFGLLIVFWMFMRFVFSQRNWNFQLASAVSIILSLVLNFGVGTYVGSTYEWQSEEFQRIRGEMKEKNINAVYLTPSEDDFFLKGLKYGDAFYLSGFGITYDKSLAQAEIIKDSSGEKLQLVPSLPPRP